MRSVILVVEDETDLLRTLDFNLSRDGHDTILAATGGEALAALKRHPLPDLILLDLMLPDISGTEICQRVRAVEATQHIPIIMLTARATENDRIAGLEARADDYVTKPFSVRELLLRVRAQLRRAQQPIAPTRISIGRLVVDKTAHRVFVDDQEIKLTVLEFKLLATLLDRPGAAHTREDLLQKVWDIHADVTTRTVDTHVKRLRAKLAGVSHYIETLRGVGYRFSDQGD